MLWGEAYKASPAGSLADDDDDLAEGAGFGMDVEAFLAVKAEILSAWTLCDDGRWYHPTVCEIVLEAWEKTSEKRKAAAAKKRAQREKARGVPTKSENVPPNGRDVPRDIPGNGGDKGGLTRVREQDMTGEDRKEEPPNPPGGQGSFELEAEEPPGGDASPDEVMVAFELWNDTADRCGLPKAKDLTDGRRRAIGKRLETGGIDGWREALLAVERSRHCRGGNDRKWRADVDFVAQEKSYQRLREGFYGEDAEPPAKTNGHAVEFSPWRGRVGEFTKNRWWEELNWGPKPGKSGCMAPAEILAEFGFLMAEEAA